MKSLQISKDWSSLDDHVIWQAFINDDKEAFAFIYQVNIRKLYGYGMKVVGNADLVEDGIQELFTELWDKRHTLCHTDHINFFLVKALRWKLYRLADNEHRRKNISNTFSQLLDDTEYALPYESMLINEQISAEQKSRLFTALEKLPARQREVLHFIFFEKRSYEETSELMAMNLRSVYTLAWKAISSLKKQILITLIFCCFIALAG